MWNIVEKIGNCYLTIQVCETKELAEKVAEHLCLIYTDRIIIVREAQKP